MKSSFAREPIGQLLKAIIDNRGKTVPTADDGIPLIATNCIKESSLYPTFENIRYVSEKTHRTWFRAHLQPEDILFVNKGTPGRVCMVPDPVNFCAAQDMIGLRADRSKVYPRYLFAFLRSDWVKETIRNYHVGLAIPHFKKQDLDTITVPKRSDDEQKAIGDLYFLLSEKIEINSRINEELEGMAKLLYDYWFVQFDFPITAAQASAMGKPRLEGKPYRASGGKMTYNEALKREIPEGWEEGEIANFCALNSKSWANNEYPESINYVDLANTKNGRIDQTVTYRKEDAPSRAQRVLRAGDTIVGTVRPENCSFAWVPDSDQALTGSTGFAVLTPKKPSYREFNYIGLTSKLNIKRLSVIASGAAYPAVNPEFVAALQIPSPPDPLLGEFHAATAASFDLREKNESQNRNLAELRDWLLPMLMNGQVTVG